MNKEKLTKEIRVIVQPSLYDQFLKCCEDDYKTISETIRGFMLKLVRDKKKEKNI